MLRWGCWLEVRLIVLHSILDMSYSVSVGNGGLITEYVVVPEAILLFGGMYGFGLFFYHIGMTGSTLSGLLNPLYAFLLILVRHIKSVEGKLAGYDYLLLFTFSR